MTKGECRQFHFSYTLACTMAASASPNMPGFGTSSSSSPYTTSPDDVFADINWPQDDNESLFDFGDFAVGATGEFYGNESFKVGYQKGGSVILVTS